MNGLLLWLKKPCAENRGDYYFFENAIYIADIINSENFVLGYKVDKECFFNAFFVPEDFHEYPVYVNLKGYLSVEEVKQSSDTFITKEVWDKIRENKCPNCVNFSDNLITECDSRFKKDCSGDGCFNYKEKENKGFLFKKK